MTSTLLESGRFRRRFAEVERLYRGDEPWKCVRECGAVFEEALRYLLMELLTRVDSASQREEIHGAEREHAKGDQTFGSFGLGQLLGVYRGAKVFDKLNRFTEHDLNKVKRRIVWREVSDLRNLATHDTGRESLDQDDATQMFTWLKLFLHDTGLLHVAGSAQEPTTMDAVSVSAECPACSNEISNRWHFCPFCGAARSPTCASCMRVLEPEFRICPFCESPVRGHDHADAQAKHHFLLVCRGAYLDHVVNRREREMLEQLRLELGLTYEEAEEIERECALPGVLEYQGLLEIVFLDGVIDERERTFLDRKAEALGLDPELVAHIEHAYLQTVSTDT